MKPNTFEEYWTMKGSRIYSPNHEETAKLAFEAGWDAHKREELHKAFENAGTHKNLCGLSKAREDRKSPLWNPCHEGWPGDGSGTDDLADYNQNEADDYRDE